MQKLYVNQIDQNGQVSTLGLFYSEAEAQKIVDMLASNPERTGYRYEIVEAERHTLADKQAERSAAKETT